MEISGSEIFLRFVSFSKGSSLSFQENRNYKAEPSYIMTINLLLLYVTHIKLIALVVFTLELPVRRL